MTRPTFERISFPSLLAALLLGCMVAGTASAVLLPFTGSITIDFDGAAGGTHGNIPPVVLALQGSPTALINASGPGGFVTALAIPAGAFALNATTPVGGPLLLSAQVSASNGTGSFGVAGGVMPISGVLRLCLLAPGCATALTLGLTPIGQGGITSDSIGGATAGITGAPWVLTFAAGPPGFTLTTALPGGTMHYATPIAFTTNFSPTQTVIGSAALTITFVPEPGTALLLGFGAFLLGLRGWKGR